RFQMIPQVDDFGHVHLVDVCEMGGRDVRLRHLVEDPLAQAVDRDPFLRAAWGYRDGGGGRRSSSHGGSSRGPTGVVLRDTSLRPSGRTLPVTGSGIWTGT